MEYRSLPHGGEKISVIGMGSSVIGARPEQEIITTVRSAMEHGVNYFDMAGGHATIFDAYGKALEGRREQVYLQVHFGADYTSGEYGWTTSLKKIKESVRWQMEKLRTDYIDFGFIHCMDEEKDLNTYIRNGVLDYILELKKKGVVRHIGMSSHTPAIAHRVLDMGILDVLMFSINPLYDYGQGDYAIGSSSERYALYRRCEKEGVGIVVMKPFCGGQLLDAEQSPFGVALGKHQCIQYALDKPGVLTVVPGYGSEAELMEVLDYFHAPEEQKDYSVIAGYTPKESEGACVYCKHCHPCPAGLDIALINKYYDLAMLGDNLAREHYLTLEKTAGDCIGCGHCDSRCPFHVRQSERMKVICEVFGK
ncbi:MAG: aldo/keto reductase [Clostridiales bacterium]|nr:aldo/keto reductase [Clostridiales bacterium]